MMRAGAKKTNRRIYTAADLTKGSYFGGPGQSRHDPWPPGLCFCKTSFQESNAVSFVLCFYFLWPAEINARGDEKQEISLVWP